MKLFAVLFCAVITSLSHTLKPVLDIGSLFVCTFIKITLFFRVLVPWPHTWSACSNVEKGTELLDVKLWSNSRRLREPNLIRQSKNGEKVVCAMNKLRAKSHFSVTAGLSGSPLAKRAESRFFFMDIRFRCSTKLNSFSISLRRLSIFIALAARMNSKCQLGAHKIGFLFLCLFSSFPRRDLLDLFINPRAWTFLFSMSRKTLRFSFLPRFFVQFSSFIFFEHNFRFQFNLMPLTICFSFVFLCVGKID